VTDNKHPEDEYRVRVTLPSLHDNQNTFWARISTQMAGAEIGSYWLPEINDEVIVAFANGDDQQPIVIGSLWNGTDTTIQTVKTSTDDNELKIPNNQQSGENNYRLFHSRSGHILVFSDEEGKEHVSLRTKGNHELCLDDSSGAERIQLYDQNNSQWLEINVPEKKITLQTDEGDIHIEAKEKITMKCTDFELEASASIKVSSGDSSEWDAGSSMKQTSGSTFDLEGGGTMTAKAPKIDLNP
jgi:uncharacterized protein involved in type VI secretion and phage assembly